MKVSNAYDTSEKHNRRRKNLEYMIEEEKKVSKKGDGVYDLNKGDKI